MTFFTRSGRNHAWLVLWSNFLQTEAILRQVTINLRLRPALPLSALPAEH